MLRRRGAQDRVAGGSTPARRERAGRERKELPGEVPANRVPVDPVGIEDAVVDRRSQVRRLARRGGRRRRYPGEQRVARPTRQRANDAVVATTREPRRAVDDGRTTPAQRVDERREDDEHADHDRARRVRSCHASERQAEEDAHTPVALDRGTSARARARRAGRTRVQSVVPSPCQYIGSMRIGATAYAPAAARPAPAPQSPAAAVNTLSTETAESDEQPVSERPGRDAVEDQEAAVDSARPPGDPRRSVSTPPANGSSIRSRPSASTSSA